MILSGPTIDNEIKDGRIHIEPYEPKNLNPASVDLTLGREVAVYEKWVRQHGKYHEFIGRQDSLLDSREPPATYKFEIPETGLVLQPGVLYLMHTHERVYTEDYVPVLDGKSSIGRLGIIVHLTAGFGDPGFNGQYTLEVTAVHQVRIYAGMRFCQMRFHGLVQQQQHMSYKDRGHYLGDKATGPVASMAYKQFEDD